MKQLYIIMMLLISSSWGLGQTLKPFVPSDKFLKENPNFTKDSTFNLNLDGLGKLDEYGKLSTDMNSENYSLKIVSFDPSLLNNDFTYYINLNTKDIAPRFKLASNTYFKYRIKEYNETNSTFLNALKWTEEFKKLEILELNSYFPVKVDQKALFLSVSCATHLWSKNYNGDIPSYAVFTMRVMDISRDTLSTYKQLVFSGNSYDDTKFKATKNAEFEALSFSKALSGLLGQLVRDKELQTILAQKLKLPMSAEQFKTLSMLNELRQLDEQKNMLLETLESDYDIETDAEKLKADNSLKNALNTINDKFSVKPSNLSASDVAITTEIGRSLNMLGGMLSKYHAEKEAEGAKIVLNVYSAVQTRQGQLLTELQNSKALINTDLGKYTSNDETIDAIANSIKKGTTEKLAEISHTTTQANERLVQRLSSAVTASNQQNNSNSVSQNSSDDCSKAANADLLKSQEFIAYKNSATHANTSDYKAKLIELTLKHCRGKLPAKEIQVLEQTAAKERSTARELRKGLTPLKAN